MEIVLLARLGLLLIQYVVLLLFWLWLIGGRFKRRTHVCKPLLHFQFGRVKPCLRRQRRRGRPAHAFSFC